MSDGGGERGPTGTETASKDGADSPPPAIAAAPARSAEVAPSRVAHFSIRGVLGRGGMGVVYRAHDDTLRRDVALKLLLDTGDAERRQRFLREARSAAALTHPNVAVVYAVGEDSGRVYIAMELMHGESLRQRLERGPVALPQALDLATQMARGLAPQGGARRVPSEVPRRQTLPGFFARMARWPRRAEPSPTTRRSSCSCRARHGT